MEDDCPRILLIDDHWMFLQALKLALESTARFQVLGMAASAEEGWRLATRATPDVVVCDIQLPDRGGFRLAEDLLTQIPGLRFVMLSGFISDALLESAVQAHVHGYLLKTDPIDELVSAIIAIAHGAIHFSASIRDRLTIDDFGNVRLRNPSPLAHLTSQQLEILKHLARGLSVKEVARTMKVTVKAVDSQKYRLMKNLNIHDRVMLSHFALEHGLISTDSPRAVLN